MKAHYKIFSFLNHTPLNLIQSWSAELYFMDGPQRKACFAKGMHNYMYASWIYFAIDATKFIPQWDVGQRTNERTDEQTKK